MKIISMIFLLNCFLACSTLVKPDSAYHAGNTESIYGIDIQVSCVHKRADGDTDVYFGYNNRSEEECFVFQSRFNRVTPVAYFWYGGAPLWTYKPGEHDKAFALAGVRHLDIVRWQLGNQYADISESTPECSDIGDIDTASL